MRHQRHGDRDQTVLGRVHEAFAIKFARVGPSDVSFLPSRAATSLEELGSAPSTAIAAG